MNARSPKMVISSMWLQIAVLTFVIGFAVLGYLAYRVHAEHPPIARQTVGPRGVVFTEEDVMAGQHLFQKYGLMSDTDSTQHTHKADDQALRQRATDWQFVRMLAHRNGFFDPQTPEIDLVVLGLDRLVRVCCRVEGRRPLEAVLAIGALFRGHVGHQRTQLFG